ncbi:MAG: DNA-binding protein, partial [Desulfobacterium sp.]|nr:DNA-binding protein [Desulfobacterium sp.]MBU4036797.1 DNA-binding protein [Pseudomonadota bacterium]
TEICRKNYIQLGRIEALGAVQKARLAFYDQQTHEYQFFRIDKLLEITQLVGNISLKDGNPMVHAHITLADKAGKTYGGHLAPGTVVFACEFILEVFEGPIFERKLDEETGLPLWTMPKEK